MEIFSENIDSIKKELELIKESFIKTNYKRLPDSFEMLEGFYQIMYEITGEEDPETIDILLKNKKYRELKGRERQLLHKKNINNFIKDKNMHNMFSGKVINVYNDKEFRYFNPKPLYLRESQMAEILCDFLNDEFNQADKFIEMAEDGRIFKVSFEEDPNDVYGTGGYTMYDYINNKSFIVVGDDKVIKDVNMMRIIAHEFGHAADNFERTDVSRKDNVRYYWVSSYAEVYSMLYEQLFFEYLIKNNIHRENASAGLKQYYLGIYDSFNSVEYLSNLEDKLLENERYKQENNIVDQITIGENGTISFDAAILENFNETKLYSYGGIIANYFANLKHNDPDKFNRELINFKAKRFNLFDFKIFEDIGTSIDEIIKIYDKDLDKITNKKLILK